MANQLLQNSELVHQSPGRLRLRSAALKGRAELAEELKATVENIYGVEEARVNSITGSVLILFDPDVIDEEALKRAAQVRARTNGAAPKQSKQKPAQSNARQNALLFSRAVRSGLNGLNERFAQVTGDKVDLTVMIPIALFGLAARDLARRRVSIPWYNLAWYGISAFRYLHPKEKPAADKKAANDNNDD